VHLYIYIVTILTGYQPGFGLDIGCIDHFNTRLGTTGNYSATTNLHNSQTTTATAELIQPEVSSPAVPCSGF
jgi:hypothetical protein